MPAPSAEQIFDGLNEHLDSTGDLQQAMRRLMQRGMGEGEERVNGLEDLLSKVAREMRRLYEKYQLRSTMDQVGEKLESIVNQEKQTLKEQGEGSPQAGEKQKFLEQLSRRASEAIEALASYDFENEQARSEFEELHRQLEQIKKLEQYNYREGNMFRGNTPLDLNEASDLLDRMESLRQLENQLSNMNMKGVNPDLLRSLLGEEAGQEFEGLARLESMLQEGGYVMQRGDHYELTPKGVRKIGQFALRDIYKQLTRDGMGRHIMRRRGAQDQRMDESRPYVYGDAFDIHMLQTLKNAMLRQGGMPLRLHPEDFAVYESDYGTRAATVLLLDMSWSMSWEGRFAAAKKVALAMESLSRALYPRDYFGIVGFFTRAIELKPKDLPEASWNMGDPFTNLQDGLHLASELLDKRRCHNQQMIVITDGQPTAYCRQGRLYCEWPLSFGGISQRAAEETLKEAERITKKGITINTFMLDDSPVLKEFVEGMTRLNKGRAFYTRPDHLGQYLLVDYFSRIRKRV
ncbi:MAG: VWA domain-containing protein [Deltaproteobacteria bacterium]|nr:VWA domain-containing protein [Deltaproteobacteria bacterium]